MGEGQGTPKNAEIADKCAIKKITHVRIIWVETLTFCKHGNLKYAYE